MISRICARVTHPLASSYWFITCCNYICVYICVCRLISHECKRSENWNANHGWGNRTVYATVLGFLRRVKLLAVRHGDLLGADCVCVCVFTSHTECTTGGRGTYAGVYAMQHDSPDRQVQCAILYDTRLMMQMSSAGRCLVICAAFDLSTTEHKLPDILRDLIRPWECWHIGENELVLIGVILPPRPVLFVHGAFLEGSPRYT